MEREELGDANPRPSDEAIVEAIEDQRVMVRARLLERIRSEYAGSNLTTLLEAPSVTADLAKAQDGWRRTVANATASGIPVPGFSAALAYYDTVRAERLPAALIQSLRDFFGAHTYRRTDRDGAFHTDWSGDRTEIAMR